MTTAWCRRSSEHRDAQSVRSQGRQTPTIVITAVWTFKILCGMRWCWCDGDDNDDEDTYPVTAAIFDAMESWGWWFRVWWVSDTIISRFLSLLLFNTLISQTQTDEHHDHRTALRCEVIWCLCVCLCFWVIIMIIMWFMLNVNMMMMRNMMMSTMDCWC